MTNVAMPSERIRVGIVGATGRLGSQLAVECERHEIPVVWRASSRSWGQPGPTSAAAPTVVIDASRGAVLPRTAEVCRDTGAALIACASDLGPDELTIARQLATLVPVVHASNLSVGHWLQRVLVAEAARISGRLPDSAMASVWERHTARKGDQPSASAHSLASAWNDAAGAAPVQEISSYRAGLPVSEHTVGLTFTHETISIQHDVRDLRAAVFGALAAVAWASSAEPGFHTITRLFDELFLEAR
jgi:4-hydroxy-tetrahydrodipicolinate reductase